MKYVSLLSISQVTIDDLIPGSRYKFRIKSENNYGISEPGDESDPFDVGGASADRYENNENDFKIREIVFRLHNHYFKLRTDIIC